MAMTTETLREAVARAIFEQEGYCRGDGDDPFLKWTWEEAVAEEYPVLAAKAREMADAAIRTVLERLEWPSDSMIEAGCKGRHEPHVLWPDAFGEGAQLIERIKAERSFKAMLYAAAREVG